MRKNRRIALLLALLMLAALLAGCSGTETLADNVSPSPKPTATEKPEPTDEPAPAEEAPATEEPAQTEESDPSEETAQTEEDAPAEEGTSAEGTTVVIDADDGDQPNQIAVEGQELPRYKVIPSDLSWSKARAACWDQGGYLAVISSREELDEIAALAEDQGLTYVWIGCHRENKTLVWENDERVDYYNWGGGEPSELDYYDFVREDFIMLRREGDHWYYNDNRDDPAGVFPEFYSGVMGYVCEYDR